MHFSAHWDPFSDAVTAGPEFNKSAGINKQELEKLNLALEMGDNVMLYLPNDLCHFENKD